MKLLLAHVVDVNGENITIPIVDPVFGNPLPVPDVIYLQSEGSPSTLANDFSITFSSSPPEGKQVSFMWRGGYFNLGGNTFSVYGVELSQEQLDSDGSYTFTFVPNGHVSEYAPNLISDSLDGAVLLDNTVDVVKIKAATDGDVYVTEGADSAAQKIANKNVASNAAIARGKLATGTPDAVVVNDNTGQMDELSFLPEELGGLGQDVSASSGFMTSESGIAQIGPMTDNKSIEVSFDAGEQGNNYIWFDSPVIATRIRASVNNPIEATDDAQIVITDGVDVVMDGDNIISGYLTIPAGSTVGTTITSTLTTNNEIDAGQRIKLAGNKSTAGGAVNTTVTFERRTLN